MELLGRRGGDIEGGGGSLQSIEFPLALLQSAPELSILCLELLEPSEDRESFLLGERDGALVIGGEEDAGVPNGHDALG